MNLLFRCPGCQNQVRTDLTQPLPQLTCPHCTWKRPLVPMEQRQDPPRVCLVCGCRDLWRQKDFPQRIGVALVAIGALLSTIAYAMYMPILSLGILMAFALGDL